MCSRGSVTTIFVTAVRTGTISAAAAETKCSGRAVAVIVPVPAAVVSNGQAEEIGPAQDSGPVVAGALEIGLVAVEIGPAQAVAELSGPAVASVRVHGPAAEDALAAAMASGISDQAAPRAR